MYSHEYSDEMLKYSSKQKMLVFGWDWILREISHLNP